MSLVVLGTVKSTYWDHNPGSRERVPAGFAPLTTAQAAEAIVRAVARDRRLVVRPWAFRLLFIVEALNPGIIAARP